MSDVLTSLQNERVKLVYGLQTRPRTRRKERKLALEGQRLIADALARGQRLEFVFYTPEKADYELIAHLQEAKVKLIPVSEAVMQYVSDTQQPQGMIAVTPIPIPPLPKQARRVLILDGIREPGNMGTILRTAGASGVEVVMLSPDCVDPYNPKALRAGMGAHFRVPIIEAKWFEIAQYTEAMPVYVAQGGAPTRYSDVSYKEAWALVIGNEAHGANNATRLGEVTPVSIPMASDTESLNAAMACAVILFEAQRQALLP